MINWTALTYKLNAKSGNAMLPRVSAFKEQ